MYVFREQRFSTEYVGFLSALFFGLSISPSVRPSGQMLLPRYFMNALSSLDKTYSEYSVAPTDDLLRFWRSNVKVTAGCRVGEGVHADAGASKSIFYSF